MLVHQRVVVKPLAWEIQKPFPETDCRLSPGLFGGYHVFLLAMQLVLTAGGMDG